jgi:transposase, IS5 family
VLRETDPQTAIWELLLLEEAKRLPAEVQAVDALLDDERFIAPWRALFSKRLGRPSVPSRSWRPQHGKGLFKRASADYLLH